MRFDLTAVRIQSRRDRGPLFKAKSEWGATAWKLTVSAPCTLADKRSRLKKKEIHMFTIAILRWIRGKNVKDTQNGWPSKCCSSWTNNPYFLMRSLKAKSDRSQHLYFNKNRSKNLIVVCHKLLHYIAVLNRLMLLLESVSLFLTRIHTF